MKKKNKVKKAISNISNDAAAVLYVMICFPILMLNYFVSGLAGKRDYKGV